MLFGKKITLFIISSLFTSLLVANNLNAKERTMSSISEKKQLIKLSQEEFIENIGDVSKYPTIQAYFDEDRRLIEGNKLIGFSDLLQITSSKQIKQLLFNIKIAELLPNVDINGTTYRIMGVLEKNYLEAMSNENLCKEIQLIILNNNEKPSTNPKSSIKLKILLFSGEKANRIAQHVFIQSLRGYTNPNFLYVKGPQTLGTLSAKDSIFDDSGKLYWVYYNSFFAMETAYIPEQNALQIAQWIFDNIEFSFNDENQ